MNTKTKILVTLAFVVALFYLLEVVLSVINSGMTAPVLVKVIIVGALLYYGVYKVRKSKTKSVGKGQENPS